MKKYFGILGVALLILVFSCQKDKVSADCPDCGKKVEEIEDRTGSVQFDASSSQYVIVMHIPGTIDAFVAGYICNLPEKYRQTGKQVVVSGTFYETTLRYQRSICCIDGNYCLAISTISEKK